MNFDARAYVNEARERMNTGQQAGQDGRKQQDKDAQAAPPKLVSAAEFVAGFTAPDFLVDDLVQRRYLYSLTAQTGHGKTAVAVTLALCVASGQDFAGRAVEQGRVAYFAGENADDVRARTILAAERFGVDLDGLPLHFFDRPFNIADAQDAITDQVSELGGLDLIVVDTLAAFFPGEDDNANVELGNFARQLRTLCELPGGPCIVTNAHPTKTATKSNMVPRGGGAFLAEVDGNLRLWSEDRETTELHWCGKIRGPGFEPLAFRMARKTSDAVKDSKGRPIPNVVAEPMAETDLQAVHAKHRRDEDALLDRMLHDPSGSMADWARQCGWVSAAGDPYKSKVSRLLNTLHGEKLVKKHRGHWTLTNDGKKEAKRHA